MKTINANINKTRKRNKARFLYNTLRKTPSSWKSLIRIYSPKWVGWGWAFIWVWLGGGVGGCLLTFSAFRMGAYRRWALVRGWALIRISTLLVDGYSPRFAYLHCHQHTIIIFYWNLLRWKSSKDLFRITVHTLSRENYHCLYIISTC